MLCITQFPVKRTPGRTVNSIRMSPLCKPSLRNQITCIHDSSLSTNSVTTLTGKLSQACSAGSSLGNMEINILHQLFLKLDDILMHTYL